MKTPKEIFTEAFALVRNPETWTRHVLARNSADRGCDPVDEEAVRWCSYGAIDRADRAGWWRPYSEAANAVAEALRESMGAFVGYFNDEHTHAEVVAAWERAGKAKGWL